MAAHGRAFGREWEIRWDEDKNGRYDLLISGEQPPPHLDASLWQPLPALTVDEAELIYLWGDHWSSLMGADDKAPNEWVTAQIEASLNYPVTGGGSDKPLVRVEARRYREAGVIRFTRFVGLERQSR
ncbi:MAG: hypothetical protein M5U34_36150 [Chloroflexi bacterium]|nr:hypothetical protein [Chloroflexota bacterium]